MSLNPVTEAIEQADSLLREACLPTYTQMQDQRDELLNELRRAEATLRNIPAWIGQADSIARVIARAGGAS